MHVFELDPSLRVNGIMGKNRMQLLDIYSYKTNTLQIIRCYCCYRGLPFWLHDVPDIIYRSDNAPFKVLIHLCIAKTQHSNGLIWALLLKLLISFHWWQLYMQNFTTKIVNLMKSEKLYASQGGPIILSQVKGCQLKLTVHILQFLAL